MTKPNRKQDSKVSALPTEMSQVSARVPASLRRAMDNIARARRSKAGEMVTTANLVREALEQFVEADKEARTTDTPSAAFDAASAPIESVHGPVAAMAIRLEEAEHRAKKAAYVVRLLKRELQEMLGGEDGDAMITVADYCARRRINIDTDKASAIGRVASAYCKQRGIETGLAPHPFYKTVKTYPVEAIEYALSQRGGNA